MDTYPPLVQSSLTKMTEDQKLTFQTEYEKRRKSLTLMVPTTIFFIHFFVYRRVGLGILYVLLCFTMVGFLWWPIELFLIPKRLREHNQTVATALAHEMKMMGA